MIEELNNLKDDLQDYIEVQLDKVKLQLAESVSRLISTVIKVIVAVCILFFILMSLSIAAGYYFSSLFDSEALGFLCVGAVYIVLMGVFFIFRRQIIDRPVIQMVVRLFFPKTGGENG